jgi:hypothetical protein
VTFIYSPHVIKRPVWKRSLSSRENGQPSNLILCVRESFTIFGPSSGVTLFGGLREATIFIDYSKLLNNIVMKAVEHDE